MFAIPPPPTYADVAIIDERTKVAQFNPIWLNWFLQVAQALAASTVTSFNGRNGGIILISSDVTGALGFTPAHVFTGLNVTITTAKLTSGGANGSMTFTNGVLTAQTAAT